MIPNLSSMLTPTLSEIGPIRLAREINSDVGGFWEKIFFGGGGLTSEARAADGLFMLIWWLGVFFFVLLMGLMVYWSIKYRRRPGVAAEPSPSHNTTLELIWTIIPSSTLIVIFALGFWGYMSRQVATSDAILLSVEGYKWGWDVTYPNGVSSTQYVTTSSATLGKTTSVTTTEVPILAVPENSRVELRMISRDVLHAFWIPDLRVKMDLYPNRYSGYTFETPDLPTGEAYQDHWIFCAEYCGDFHSEMAAVLRVYSAAGYEAWLDDQKPNGTPCEMGAQIWKVNGCSVCHSVDGSSGTGPTWQDLYGNQRDFSNAGSEVAGDDYIRESILNPGAKIVSGYANQMQSYQGVLDESDISNLIAYMKSISANYDGPDPCGGADETSAENEGAEDERAEEGTEGAEAEAPGGEPGDDPADAAADPETADAPAGEDDEDGEADDPGGVIGR